MRVVGEAEVACELYPVVGVKSLELVLDEISVKAMLDVEIPVVGSEGVVSKLSEKKKIDTLAFLPVFKACKSAGADEIFLLCFYCLLILPKEA